MTRPMTRMTTAAALTLLLLTAACGGGSAESADPTGAGTPAEDAAGASLPEDICSAFTAAEFEAVVGAPGTLESLPGGGCEYSQEDPRAVSVSINALPVVAASDYDAARSGATSTLDSPEITDGETPGDHSFVGIGTMFGGDNLQGSGGATNGEVIVLTTVIQAEGLPADKVSALSVDLLELAAAKLF
jgi:hypothetical protein